MIIQKVAGHTRVMGAPENWNEAADGPCSGLPIKDVEIGNLRFMLSEWKPTDYELKLLNEGAVFQLYINGTSHPVVSCCIGPPETP